MANTFGILAAVALLFGAFVSFKNKGQLESLASAISKEEGIKAKQTKIYEGLNADIDQLVAEKADYDKTKEETQAALEKQVAANADLDQQIASKRGEADAAKAKADEAEEVLNATGDVRELVPKMKTLRSDIAQLDDDISINAAVVDRLEGSKNQSVAQAQNLAEIISQGTSGVSYFESTKVRSVFRQWGFVTLAGGDKIGVVKKSKLSVLRGGEEIAQLIVTGVEPNSAAANIIPSSVKGDVTVSPGDTVVPIAEEAAQPNGNGGLASE